MDEVQLIGEGLAITTQLEAFRRAFGTIFPVHSLWMSATFNRDWLKTTDFSSSAAGLTEFGLSAEGKEHPLARKRFEAKKSLEKADLPGEKLNRIGEMILDSRQSGTRTLPVFNTVDVRLKRLNH
jgi:CRISPR-associated endonuclease/helicase Cas3